MSYRILITAGLSLTLTTLTSCIGLGPSNNDDVIPTTPPASGPASGTITGYNFPDPGTGTVDLYVTVFDSKRTPISEGTFTDAAVVSAAIKGGNGLFTPVSPTASTCKATLGQVSTDPLAAALVLDSTGSMSSTDPASTPGDFTTTKRYLAAKSFVESLSSQETAAVASFDVGTPVTAGYLAIKLHQGFTSDKTALVAGVKNATFEGGTTPLWDAVYDATELLNTQASKNRVAIVVTDGADNASTKKALDGIGNAQRRGVRVYMIGLGGSLDKAAMQLVATQTGGLYGEASDASKLQSVFDEVREAVRRAVGCIRLTISPLPAANTPMSGVVKYKVDGKELYSNFSVQF